MILPAAQLRGLLCTAELIATWRCPLPLLLLIFCMMVQAHARTRNLEAKAIPRLKPAFTPMLP